ncbi:hypothetical protein WDW37_15375 [Bdellovibrionota bacterium FG-1]
MSIPGLNKNGELPPGEHSATLQELEEAFGKSTPKRQELVQKLKLALSNFKAAKVPKIWVNGSFTTTKSDPADIDGAWDFDQQTDITQLDPVFLDANGTDAQKHKYGLDFYPNVIEMGSGLPFPGFFQTNRSGEPKGILVIKVHP